MNPCVRPAGENLIPFDGEAVLQEPWLPPEDAQALMDDLVSHLDWAQEHARFGAKVIALPRLTAWYGDVGYAYSGVYHPPSPWPVPLARLRDSLGALAAPGSGTGIGPQRPNSVLVNYYRDGTDSMGWHSDDEPSLGYEPTIWSVSLGATRRFVLRHRASGHKVSVDLTHGSLFVMAGACQRCWQHALPKVARPVGPRLNLTFRVTAPGAVPRQRGR